MFDDQSRFVVPDARSRRKWNSRRAIPTAATTIKLRRDPIDMRCPGPRKRNGPGSRRDCIAPGTGPFF